MTEKLPSAAGELFGLLPKDFTKRRNELAKQLKDSGDVEGSKKVAALSRPSLSAWALNQVARWNPKLIQELLAVDETLRKPASASEFRQASAERSRTMGKILQAAWDILQKNGHSAGAALGNKITQTLRAVGSDDEARAALVEGRLVRDLEAENLIDQAWDFRELQPEPEPEPPVEDKEETERIRQTLIEEVERLQAEAGEYVRAAKLARQAADKARKDWEKARAQAEEAEQQAHEATKVLERQKAELRRHS